MNNTLNQLKSEAEYILANERASELMDLEFELGSEIHQKLQMLVTQIKEYQAKHYVI